MLLGFGVDPGDTDLSRCEYRRNAQYGDLDGIRCSEASRMPVSPRLRRPPIRRAIPPMLALILVAAPALGADYAWPVVRVIDGDTVAVDASADMPPELADIKIRLRGVDTPEKGRRAKCDAERAASRAATAFTSQAIAGARAISVRDPVWGKWGGRVVADLIVDGRSLSAALIAAGHGRPYDGGRRGGWCGQP